MYSFYSCALTIFYTIISYNSREKKFKSSPHTYRSCATSCCKHWKDVKKIRSYNLVEKKVTNIQFKTWKHWVFSRISQRKATFLTTESLEVGKESKLDIFASKVNQLISQFASFCAEIFRATVLSLEDAEAACDEDVGWKRCGPGL